MSSLRRKWWRKVGLARGKYLWLEFLREYMGAGFSRDFCQVNEKWRKFMCVSIVYSNQQRLFGVSGRDILHHLLFSCSNWKCQGLNLQPSRWKKVLFYWTTTPLFFHVSWICMFGCRNLGVHLCMHVGATWVTCLCKTQGNDAWILMVKLLSCMISWLCLSQSQIYWHFNIYSHVNWEWPDRLMRPIYVAWVKTARACC